MRKNDNTIDMLRDFPDLTPIYRESITSKLVRVFNREIEDCRNYLSANRREFYKILMITGGYGVFTLGLNKYVIDKPAIIFIHPNDIISWQKTSKVNYNEPVNMRTAKEFAATMLIHPNYLNRVLKKHTGQNVSAHIKGRILDECKALLLQTSWSLEQISYSVGFSDQPNFNFFFKKNTGLTPSEFRKMAC